MSFHLFIIRSWWLPRFHTQLSGPSSSPCDSINLRFSPFNPMQIFHFHSSIEDTHSTHFNRTTWIITIGSLRSFTETQTWCCFPYTSWIGGPVIYGIACWGSWLSLLFPLWMVVIYSSRFHIDSQCTERVRPPRVVVIYGQDEWAMTCTFALGASVPKGMHFPRRMFLKWTATFDGSISTETAHLSGSA